MKNFRLYFVALLGLFCFFLACQNETPTQPQQKPIPQNQTVQVPVPKKGTLFNFGDSPATTFYMSTRSFAEVSVVGIEHTEQGEPRVSPRIEARYNHFWDLYFANTQFSRPTAFETRLVMEFHFHDRPDFGLGTEFTVAKARLYITEHLFRLGVHRVVVGDMRDRSDESRAGYNQVLGLFEARKGETNLVYNQGPSAPFPKIEITKEPKLTQDDIEWLKTVWYPKVYQVDSVYEAGLKRLWDEHGYISVIGLAHAIRLHERYGMEIALIDQGGYIHSAMKSVAEQEYFLEVIKKK